MNSSSVNEFRSSMVSNYHKPACQQGGTIPDVFFADGYKIPIATSLNILYCRSQAGIFSQIADAEE